MRDGEVGVGSRRRCRRRVKCRRIKVGRMVENSKQARKGIQVLYAAMVTSTWRFHVMLDRCSIKNLCLIGGSYLDTSLNVYDDLLDDLGSGLQTMVNC